MSSSINQPSPSPSFDSQHSDPRQGFLTFDPPEYLYPMSVLAQVPNQANLSKPTGPLWAMLKSWSISFLIFNFSFLISACGLDVEDPTPPSPPVWVEKSLPEEWPERGIDAHESGGIFLEWYDSPEENIVAYKIYRAQLYNENDSLGGYDLMSIVETKLSTSLEYIDGQAEENVKYFYKIKAIDGSDNSSDYSDSLGYSLLPKLFTEYMTPNGSFEILASNRLLSWHIRYTIEMEDYCISILDEDGDLILRQVISPGHYFGSIETFTIPESVTLEDNCRYRWRIDIGANYLDGYETSGSESPWATFIYIGN